MYYLFFIVFFLQLFAGLECDDISFSLSEDQVSPVVMVTVLATSPPVQESDDHAGRLQSSQFKPEVPEV